MSQEKRAVILAGGKGTRLKPYTTLIPKPLVPIGGKFSILELIIQQLKSAGFNYITISVNHLSHLIQSFIGDGSRFGIKIDYSIEDKALSTIGPLKLIDNLPENFLVMNGDIICNLDYANFFETHCNAKHEVSVASCKREQKIDFGVLSCNEKNQLIDFLEKPCHTYLVSMGIYCINKNALNNLVKNQVYGFDQLMYDRLKEKKLVNIFKFEGLWLDIGRPEDYDNANENFSSIAEKLGIKNE